MSGCTKLNNISWADLVEEEEELSDFGKDNTSSDFCTKVETCKEENNVLIKERSSYGTFRKLDNEKNVYDDFEEGWSNQKYKKKIPRRENPQIICVKDANSLQEELNITGLSKVLLSKESRLLQIQGYKFISVLTLDNFYKVDDKYKIFKIINVNNKWKDKVLFAKI